MKKIFTFLSAFFCIGLIQAQTTVTIGTGTGTSTTLPITGNYGYSYSQSIYTADEIRAAGGDAGMINKIRYYYSSGTYQNSTNWDVYLGNTLKSAFANNNNWIPGANMTRAFSGTVTMPSSNGNWIEVTLSTPFFWNGSDNLVIAVDENAPGFSSSTLYWGITNTSSSTSIYYNSDPSNINPASPPPAKGTPTNRPNLQLDMQLSPCTGAPVHDITIASAAGVCPRSSITFSTDTFSVYSGMKYTWQYNTGNGWNDFANSNRMQFTTDSLLANAQVRQVATCTHSNLSDTTTPVSVTVYPVPQVQVNSPSHAICNGTSATLIASGANTYSWSPTTALNRSDSSTVISTPTAPTTYTVTGTSSQGCVNTARVTVSPVKNLKPIVSQLPASICTTGSPVQLTLGGLPSTPSGGGTFEYQFIGEDTVSVLRNWAASSSYTFTPTIEKEYAFYYRVRNTACPAEYSDSVRSTLFAGFKADVSTVDFNCNRSGSFTFRNVAGQMKETTIYENALNSAAALNGFATSGAASINSGRAVITPSATSQTGYMVLNQNGMQTGINNSMNISFLLTADLPINTFGTGGADGLTYSFGNDALPGSGNAHNGKGSKLRLCFDAAFNGSENGNASGIYLVYGWTASNAYGPASTAVLAYSSNTALWKLKTDVPVTLSINTSGKATVTVGSTTVFTDVQLPASYLTENVSNWNHLFSAGTGGDALRQAISGFKIAVQEMGYGMVNGNSATPPTTWQTEPVFDSLNPGVYSLWMANPGNTSCNKKLGTYEIHHLNPKVNLGNDTSLCDATGLLLQAGNTGSKYAWSNGDTTQTTFVTSSGTYHVLVTDTAGCTATDTINVKLNHSTNSDTTAASCNTFRWHGSTYTTSGDYERIITNAAGCDSVITLHLTINNSTTGDTTATACNTFSWHGNTYTTSGDYGRTIINSAGCDSVITLHLTINNSTTGDTTATACNTFSWHGNTYTTSGDYGRTVINSAGCDSVITLHLTINNSTTSDTTATTCNTFSWYGNTYTTSGDYERTITNTAGCDSVITLHLTINNSTAGDTTATACNTFSWYGNTYTTSGDYERVTSNVAGCDSVITLHLTINTSTSSDTTASACNTFTWHGNTYTTSGDYERTIINAAGCDSVITLHLTINTSTSSDTTASACNTFTWHGNTYTTSGDYERVTSNAAGCDSVITLHLTIDKINLATTIKGDSAGADQDGASYQWINCDNGNEVINGATAQWYRPAQSGNYAVIVTNGACKDTSACVHIVSTGLREQLAGPAIQVYPNPVKDVLNIVAETQNEITIELYNQLSELVYTTKASVQASIDISAYASGVYYLKTEVKGYSTYRKVVKQ